MKRSYSFVLSADASLISSNCSAYKAYVSGEVTNSALFADSDIADEDNDPLFVGAGTNRMDLAF